MNLFRITARIGLFVIVIGSLAVPMAISQARSSPKQEKLLNGLKVLMWSDPKADNVSIKIRIHAGSAFDPQGKEGLMEMLSDDLFPNEAAREFFTEDLGGGLEIVTAYDFIQINASTRPDALLTMLETISAAVSNPAIDKETTARLQTALLARVAASNMSPAYVADQAVAARLFDTFPYGRPIGGTEASVKKIDFADLIDAKDRFLTADNATIAINGNFDRSLGLKAIRRYFGGWLKADKRVPSTFRQPDDPPAALLNLDSPKPGVAAIRFAVRGVARADKDLQASQIFTSIVKDRLKRVVPRPHINDVFVRNEAHALPGIIIIGFSSEMNEAGNAKDKVEANDLVSRSLADPITDAEFQAGKTTVKASWENQDWTSFWLDADTYKTAGPDAEFRALNNVTIADVRSYVEKFRKLPIVTVLVDTPAKTN